MAKKKKEEVKIQKTSNIDKLLIENFVSLQKVLASLSIKLDGLTTQISKLLQLFEVSAKSFSEKGSFNYEKYKDGKDLAQKIDALLEQNKTFAKGIALMYERPSVRQPEQSIPQREEPPQMQMPAGLEGYQHSLSTAEPEMQVSSNPKFKQYPGK